MVDRVGHLKAEVVEWMGSNAHRSHMTTVSEDLSSLVR